MCKDPEFTLAIFCCDFRCDFLLLMYVNEWMSWECLDEVTYTQSIHNLFTRGQKLEF